MAIRNDYYFTNRESTFLIEVNGLMPITEHFLYFETKKVDASKLKPYGGNAGDPVKTDENGYVRFYYTYDTGLSSGAYTLAQAQSQKQLLSGNKEIILGNQDVATVPLNYASTWTSFWKTHIIVMVDLP